MTSSTRKRPSRAIALLALSGILASGAAAEAGIIVKKNGAILLGRVDPEDVAMKAGKDGKDEPDKELVYKIMSTTLDAIVELHKRRPKLDLSQLSPAVNALVQNGNLTTSAQAERTRKAIFPQ